MTASMAASALLLSLVAASFLFGADAGSSIGLNYGTMADNLITPEETVNLMLKTTVRKVKIYDTNPRVMRAFANSGIQMVVCAPNDVIEPLARSGRYAMEWVMKHVAAYRPATDIKVVVVGNEVLTSNQTTDAMRAQLLPAMTNVHSALVSLKLDADVKVSTPHSMEILASSFPPSRTVFKPSMAETVLAIAGFLAQTGSSMMMNIHPYFALRDDPRDVNLLYALGQGPNPGETDANTGIHYNDLFSAQLDACFYALLAHNLSNLAVVVSESGWPTAGDPSEIAASVVNAQSYIYNLVGRVSSNAGTPARPGIFTDVYLFSTFNEDLKPGPASERNFGLFYPDGRPVYDSRILGPDLHFSPGPQPSPALPSPPLPPPPVPATTPPPAVATPPPAAATPPPAEATPPPVPVLPPPPPPPPPAAPVPVLPPPAPVSPPPEPMPVPTQPEPLPEPTPSQPTPEAGATWCVAKPGAGAEQLLDALSYACSQSGVDCTPIQEGGACFLPNLLAAHTSYAMDQYYQHNGRNVWNCFFNGNSVITITDPSTATCIYP